MPLLSLVRPAMAFILLAAGALGSLGEAAGAPPFAPHRAVYELSLLQARQDSGVVGASGSMEFTWGDVCDGWVVTHNAVVVLSRGDSGQSEFGWKLSTWESKDGLKFRFFIKRFLGGGLVEEVEGSAALDDHEAGGNAIYSKPDEKVVGLPPGTYFPTEHSLLMLEHARAGEPGFQANVFDGGNDNEGTFLVNAIRIREEGAKVSGLSSPLIDGVQGWRYRLAYFPLNESDAAPDSEQEVVILDNGVVSELLLDYSSFVVKAKLVEIEALPDPGC